MAELKESSALLEMAGQPAHGGKKGHRGSTNDMISWYTTHGDEYWDLCMVVKRNDTAEKEIEELVERLEHPMFGFETKKYLSVQDDEIYLLLRASLEKLKSFSESINMATRCDPLALETFAANLSKKFPGVADVRIPDGNQFERPKYKPYEFIYLPYRRDPIYEQLWVKKVVPGSRPSPFGTVDRVKLALMILEQPLTQGGCELDLPKMREHGYFIFPLHTPESRDILIKEWLHGWRALIGWIQPYEIMREYFGEMVTLYFMFLGTHCRWLFFLGTVGTLIELDVFRESTTEAKPVAFFAVLVALWSSCFTEFWKRREAFLAMVFGTSNFEANEPYSSAFLRIATPTPSLISGLPDFRYPTSERLKRVARSNIIIFICVFVIISVNVGLYASKIWMRDCTITLLAENYKNIFNVILSVAISMISVLYTTVAENLTRSENHRTETEHRDSLIFKLFFVQFINSYASLYYTAFGQQPLEGSCSGYDTCMDSLCYLVATILLERLVFTFIYDNLLPRIMAWKRFREETAGLTEEQKLKFTFAESQFVMDEYDERMEMVNRYMDQVIMFGYMVLFVTAFPMGPLIGYISNVYQINQFGSTLLLRKQRNPPRTAQDIGTFQGCFENVSRAAVVTNSALVFFTMRNAYFGADYSTTLLVWYFFILIGCIFYVMDLIDVVIPDVDEDVTTQLNRQEFLTSKVIEHSTDEEDDSHAGIHQLPRAHSLKSRDFLLGIST